MPKSIPLIFAAASIAAVPACGSSGSGPANVATDSSQPALSGPLPGLSRDHLTGIGATRAGFAAAHELDPDPRAAPGCCFLPNVHNSGTASGQDQYGPVLYGDGYVVNETVNFDTGTRQAQAASVTARELPRDVEPVRKKSAPVCLSFLYRSNMLAKNAQGLGRYVTVSYYGPFDGPYDPNDVEEVIILPETKMIGRC